MLVFGNHNAWRNEFREPSSRYIVSIGNGCYLRIAADVARDSNEPQSWQVILLEPATQLIEWYRACGCKLRQSIVNLKVHVVRGVQERGIVGGHAQQA